MKTIYLLILLFLGAVAAEAQNLSADTAKAHQLENQAWMLGQQQGKPAEAIELFDQAAELYFQNELWEDFRKAKWNVSQFYIFLGQGPKAITNQKQVIQRLGSENPSGIIAYRDLARAYNEGMQDFKKGIEACHNGYKMAIRLFGEKPSPQTSVVCNCLTITNLHLGQDQEAMGWLEKGIEMDLKLHGEVSFNVSMKYMNAGVVFTEMGEYQKSIGYFEKSIDILKKTVAPNHSKLSKAYQQIGLSYGQIGDFDLAISYYQNAAKIIKNNPKIPPKEQADLYTYMAITYGRYGYIDSSITFLNEAKAINDELYGPSHPNSIAYWINAGEIYLVQGSYAEALEYFEKAHQLRSGIYPPRHHKLAMTLNHLAETYRQNDSLSLALATINQAFATNSPSAEPPLLFAPFSPFIQQHSFLDDATGNFSMGIRGKILKSWYEKTNELEHLQSLYEHLQAQSLFLAKFKSKMSSDGDKLFYTKNAQKIYSEGADLSGQLFELTDDQNYLESMLSFAEQNKSVLLAGALQSDKARRFGEIPDSLAKQEQAIERQIAGLEKQVLDAQRQSDSLATTKAQSALFNSKRELEQFGKMLETNYPKYHQLKYSAFEIKLQDIQESLSQEDLLLEYFAAEDQIFVIAVSKTATKMHKIAYPKDSLRKDIRTLRQVLSDGIYISKNKEIAYNVYVEKAHKFYQRLLQEALAEHSKGNLVIIPDGLLGHIPFEALLTATATGKKGDYRSLPYLLVDYNVSYSYSASLLLENKQRPQPKHNGKLLGFAASYNAQALENASRSAHQSQLRGVLGDLPAARKEVEKLEKAFEGSFFYSDAANEAEFKSTARQYGFIHLAMHGMLDKRQPIASSMVFTENSDSIEDNFLYAYEISNMDFNAELLVLSACETGFGKFEQGEGVMSLARSFMYAGVPSLVVSLWQVNDQSTATIMELFYQNLASGQRKDEALRNAKIAYIQRAKGFAAHPTFWAAFVQLGDSRPVSISAKGGWLVYGIGGGVLLLVLGAGLWWRRPKREA